MRKVQPLVELQRLDLALDRERERLALVRERLEDDSALQEARSARAAAERALRLLQSEQRDLDLQVSDLQSKLDALEKKLYSGTVQNPKELDNMSRDAQQFRSLISTREDRLLELFDQLDEAEQTFRAAEQQLGLEEQSHQVTLGTLRAELAALTDSIAANDALRASIAATADAASLRSYESLRRSRGGLAVAEVAQRTCQGCRVSLPVSEATRARASDQLVFCQSCGRILYAFN